MKKFGFFFAALILAVVLCACGAQDVPETPDVSESTSAPKTEELKHIDLNMISPYEAMQLLYEIQKKLK